MTAISIPNHDTVKALAIHVSLQKLNQQTGRQPIEYTSNATYRFSRLCQAYTSNIDVMQKMQLMQSLSLRKKPLNALSTPTETGTYWRGFCSFIQ